jgi:hypothetical protein
MCLYIQPFIKHLLISRLRGYLKKQPQLQIISHTELLLLFFGAFLYREPWRSVV